MVFSIIRLSKGSSVFRSTDPFQCFFFHLSVGEGVDALTTVPDPLSCLSVCRTCVPDDDGRFFHTPKLTLCFRLPQPSLRPPDFHSLTFSTMALPTPTADPSLGIQSDALPSISATIPARPVLNKFGLIGGYKPPVYEPVVPPAKPELPGLKPVKTKYARVLIVRALRDLIG